MSMGRSSLLRLALFWAVAGIAIAPLFGQAFYGSAVGTVADQSGGVLHGATVTLTNVETGERRQTLSVAGGDSQFLNLVPGTCRVEVEQAGFKKATRDNIEVTVSGTVRADISMQFGASDNGLASMLLGFGSSGSERALSVPWESLRYRGYYAKDTWQATPKLTLTAGVRYEIPGVGVYYKSN